MLSTIFRFLLSWVWADNLCAMLRCIQILSSWNESSVFWSHRLNCLHIFRCKKKPKKPQKTEHFANRLFQDTSTSVSWWSQDYFCSWGKAHSFAVGVAPFWYCQTMLIFPLACRYESILLLNWLRSGGTECSTSSSSNDFYLVEILVGRDRRIALLGVVQLGCGWHMRDNSD